MNTLHGAEYQRMMYGIDSERQKHKEELYSSDPMHRDMDRTREQMDDFNWTVKDSARWPPSISGGTATNNRCFCVGLGAVILLIICFNE